jgi:hypothetical protein
MSALVCFFCAEPVDPNRDDGSVAVSPYLTDDGRTDVRYAHASCIEQRGAGARSDSEALEQRITAIGAVGDRVRARLRDARRRNGDG